MNNAKLYFEHQDLLNFYDKCACKDSRYEVLINFLKKTSRLVTLPIIIEEMLYPAIKGISLRRRAYKPWTKIINAWVHYVRNYLPEDLQKHKDEFTSFLKVRPLQFICRGSDMLIEWHYTTYYYSTITNFCPELRINSKTVREVLEPLILSGSETMPVKSISQCVDLPLSNHLGFCAFLFTKDGHIILQLRSRKVSIEKGTISPSIAGSVDPQYDFLRNILIEAEEELGLLKKDIKLIRYLALVRNLVFIGKPDILLLGILDITSDETKKKVENIIKDEYVDVLLLPAKNILKALISENTSRGVITDELRALTDKLRKCSQAYAYKISFYTYALIETIARVIG